MNSIKNIYELNDPAGQLGSASWYFFNSFITTKVPKADVLSEIETRRSFYNFVYKRLQDKDITDEVSVKFLSYLEMLQIAIEDLEVKAGIKDARKLKAAALHMAKKMQSSVH